MPRRFVAILLLVVQTVFLNMVVPGHTRGKITLGGESTTTAADSCCHHSQKNECDSTPTPADQQRCAVCYLAAHFTPPPVFDVDLKQLGLLEVLPAQTRAAEVRSLFIHTYDACGPPRAAHA